MVLFVTNKPLIELICLKNDGFELELYQNKRNWYTYFGDYKKKKKKKKREKAGRNISSSFQWETCGPQKPGPRNLEFNRLVCSE